MLYQLSYAGPSEAVFVGFKRTIKTLENTGRQERVSSCVPGGMRLPPYPRALDYRIKLVIRLPLELSPDAV